MRSAPGSARTALEQELLTMWSERLDGQPLGVSDHFFGLGGDSLGALRLVAAIQRRYGVRIDRRRLFETFTVAAMAELISEATRGSEQ